MRKKLLFRLAVIALALGAASCEDNDLFATKKIPLSGERKPLFPNGVPGVDYAAPPAQPSNSNIPITTTIADPAEQQQQQAEAEEEKKQKTARGAQRNRRANAQPDPNDPWADARTARPD